MSNDNTVVERCLFPVAGYGTRFLPVTKSMPKEMLPVVNKPLVQYGVEEAVAAGLTHINFVTSRGKRAIADYFDVSYELESELEGSPKEELLHGIRNLMEQASFSFTRQKNMRGLGNAVAAGEVLIGDNPFGVILADDLCLTDGLGVMAQLKAVYERYHCPVVAVEEVPDDSISAYGVVAGKMLEENILRVREVVEKPALEDAPSNLAIIGRYILTADIFRILETVEPDKNSEIQLTDALIRKASEGELIAVKCQARRFDCGRVDGFVAATNFCYNEMLKDGRL